MIFKNLDFSPGKITYDDFDIDPNKTFEQQIFSLKEDMLQVNYDHEYLIDVGWGPEFSLKGKFKVRIIKSFDWTNPVYFKKTSNLEDLQFLLKACIDKVREFIEKENQIK